MKPQLLKVSTNIVQSFSARRDTEPDINSHWHYHPEAELIYFKSGGGTQFIGDSIEHFKSGDIVLVGGNLPHFWKYDDEYFKDDAARADVIVIHFNENFWGDVFLNLPENKAIRDTLELGKRGIRIRGIDKNVETSELMERLVCAEGPSKIMLLMEVLMSLGSYPQKQALASMGFHYNFQEAEKDRINAIYNYTIANFKNKIKLEEIAAIANVSPNSFCRFFKSRSHKTYSQFINEIRVGHACKLLIDNQLNVKEICYESGFYNFASFHKYFKQITGKSPLGYQKTFVRN
ncbi:helix-turn-helix domain-containing protein [Mucilaginibacter roseus]|uniref:Helix-turn-helix domain-containing protein n=1 Tax=Mucilaginibacter roseus TaxID=1528868 RepID=A0ABS8TYS2_9SPHI|nr:helix-turn-helix domain-containing protein [Mucilaginibacter roseus]MCD8740014.1 helix-turn-helix domain-containing protein [Mucilaginibacter roseus]